MRSFLFVPGDSERKLAKGPASGPDALILDLEDGVAWTGWHALEKQLWVTGLDETSTGLAQQLVTDTEDLVARIDSIELTITQMGNGAKELLDEVATGKVTGEEERYSHTDLWDFYANVEGSRAAVGAVRPVLDQRDAELGKRVDGRFEAVESMLVALAAAGIDLESDAAAGAMAGCRRTRATASSGRAA